MNINFNPLRILVVFLFTLIFALSFRIEVNAMASQPLSVKTIEMKRFSTGIHTYVETVVITSDGKMSFEHVEQGGISEMYVPKNKLPSKDAPDDNKDLKNFSIGQEVFEQLAEMVQKSNFFKSKKKYKTRSNRSEKDERGILAQPGSDEITLTVSAEKPGGKVVTHSTKATYRLLGDKAFPDEIEALYRKIAEIIEQTTSGN